MTDRELLELAAKAAGLRLGELDGRVVRYESDGQPVYWRPLTDDGDALRLAVKLRLEIVWWKNGVSVESEQRETGRILPFVDSPEAATRLAIVRAAAAIGEAMQ